MFLGEGEERVQIAQGNFSGAHTTTYVRQYLTESKPFVFEGVVSKPFVKHYQQHCCARPIINRKAKPTPHSMRRVQLTPASGKNPNDKKEAATSCGSRGALGLGKPAKTSSPFNVPVKRRGDEDDTIHGQSTNIAPHSPVFTQQHNRDTTAQQAEKGEYIKEEAPSPVVCKLKRTETEEERVNFFMVAVATVEDVCSELGASTIELAEAGARLDSLSTENLLAAAPFKHPKEREDIFEVQHAFLLVASFCFRFFFACTLTDF